METLISYLKEYGYYLFLGAVIMYFLTGRKPRVDRKKAVAIFYHALSLFLLFTSAILIEKYQLTPHMIWLPVTVVAGAMLYFRRRVFPYPKHCMNCGATIAWKERWIEENKDCSACRIDSAQVERG